MKTAQELMDLKMNWKADACWDIENTEGFEEYRTELLIFRLRTENDWMREELTKHNNFRNGLIKYLDHKF